MAKVELVTSGTKLTHEQHPDSSNISELALSLGEMEEKEMSLGEKLDRLKLLLQQASKLAKQGWRAKVSEGSRQPRVDLWEKWIHEESELASQTSKAKIKTDQLPLEEKNLTLKPFGAEQLLRKLEARVALLESRSRILASTQKTTFSISIYLSIILALLAAFTFGGVFARRCATLSTW